MAGPALPENIDSTYADTGDASVPVHQQHHDAIHDVVNKFDKDATPSSGDALVWDGSLWQPVNRQQVWTFSMAGSLFVETGPLRLYNDTGRTLTILSVRGSVGTAPTGASVLVDVNINGTTIWGTQSNRITIAVSTNTDEGGTPSVTTIADGQYFTFDVDQVGSTITGSDLTVQIWTVG